jgi:hypothetical protein
LLGWGLSVVWPVNDQLVRARALVFPNGISRRWGSACIAGAAA